MTTFGSAVVRLILAFFPLLVMGCVSTQITGPGAATSHAPAAAADRFCVMRPADGRFGANVYTGSGQTVANRIVEVLQQRYQYVRLLPTENEAAAFTTCRAQQGRFLIVPSIVHWEDRAMQWSAMPDRVKVQLALHDLADDASIPVVTFEAHQLHGLHFTDSPTEDLLDHAFDEAILRLVS